MGTVSGLAMVVVATAWIQSPAWAQTDRAADPAARRPVQIGGGWDVFATATDEGGAALMMPNVRVTIPFGRRFAVEGSVGFYHEFEQIEGFYGVQIKQRMVRASSAQTEVFATYGALGWYSHERARTISYTSYNGTPETVRLPSRTDFQPPVIAVVGSGMERRVASRLAVRVDVQGFVCVVYPVAGARVVGSVSIPIGRLTN
jgi:hypothetical protein